MLHEMVRLADREVFIIDTNKIENSKEINDSYMIYTINNQEYVMLDDYNMFIKRV